MNPLDERYMREALALAEQGRAQVAPNPVVGCIIIRAGKVVGRGWHREYGACHAEVAALTEAGPRSRGATMYVTLQPCNHYGKTPPCTSAVIRSGIRRLVIAAVDPNPKTCCDDGLRRICAAGIEVESGVLAAEAERQNEFYFHNLRQGRPFVALKLAATLDGRIADSTGKSQWITSEAARDYARHLRGRYQAILVGAGTVRADNPRLTCRIPGRRNPVRVILAGRRKLPGKSRVFTGPGRTLVIPGLRLSWPSILDRLYRSGISSVLVEGGARVAASALDAGIVDKLYYFIAPRILGPGLAPSDHLRPRGLEAAIQLKDWRVIPVGPDLLIEAGL